MPLFDWQAILTVCDTGTSRRNMQACAELGVEKAAKQLGSRQMKSHDEQRKLLDERLTHKTRVEPQVDPMIHHTSKTELRGVVVESFRTLAAKDAWHSAQGYRAGRDMYLIVLDAEHGEVERHRCDIRQVRNEPKADQTNTPQRRS